MKALFGSWLKRKINDITLDIVSIRADLKAAAEYGERSNSILDPLLTRMECDPVLLENMTCTCTDPLGDEAPVMRTAHQERLRRSEA
jgi:hypothetical protein